MIASCAECHKYEAREIELGLPAFCRYFAEGILTDNPICRHYREGQVPLEPICHPQCDNGADHSRSVFPCAAHQGTEGDPGASPTSEMADQNVDEHIQSYRDDLPKAGRHHFRVISVQGYIHNFPDYAGPRARLKLQIIDGPDAGKLVWDNIAMPHPQESEGRRKRRIRIAVRLGLIQKGTKELVRIDWKSLEGVVVWADIDYKSFGGREVLTLDNYELQ